MAGFQTPWFPGKFGTGDGEDGPADSAGDTDEPYAAASLPGRATSPYWEIPQPEPADEEADWLPEPTQRSREERLAEKMRHYGGFYEPGAASPEDFRPPKRPGRLARLLRGGRERRRAENQPGGVVSGLVTTARPEPPRQRDRAHLRGRAPARSTPPPGTAPVKPPGGETEPGRAGVETGLEEVGELAGAERARRRRRRGVGIVVGVLVLGVVIQVPGWRSGGDDGTTEPPPASGPAAPASPPPALDPPEPAPLPELPGQEPVGETVRDGPFEVEVVTVATGLEQIGEEDSITTAEGEFVVVVLDVQATEEAIFLDSDHRLVDADGQRHAPHATAGAVLPGNRLALASLRPGDRAEGLLVFDVDPGTEPAELRLFTGPDGDEEGVAVGL